jgi:hypothetical protein
MKYANMHHFSKVGGNYPLDLKIIWSSVMTLSEGWLKWPFDFIWVKITHQSGQGGLNWCLQQVIGNSCWPQSSKWKLDLTGPNQREKIHFYIVLNKNWKIKWSEQNLTGLGPEDQCSSWGLWPYWLHLQMDLPLGLSLSVICCLSSACCLQIPRHLSKSLLILDSSFL